MVLMSMAAPPLVVQHTIKLPQILLLNSSGGSFSDQGPLAFASGFHGLLAVGLVCKILATALRKSSSIFRRIVRRNLTQKLVPFTFDENDFSKLLRENKVFLCGAFPNDCVSGLKTSIIDILDNFDPVHPHFCHMVLCVQYGKHKALLSFLGNHGFLKVHRSTSGEDFCRIEDTMDYKRFVNSANVLVMVFFFHPPWALDAREMQLDSFIEARFNGDCFTIWRSHSTGTYKCYLS
jgi:hypothetical protein